MISNIVILLIIICKPYITDLVILISRIGLIDICYFSQFLKSLIGPDRGLLHGLEHSFEADTGGAYQGLIMLKPGLS